MSICILLGVPGHFQSWVEHSQWCTVSPVRCSALPIMVMTRGELVASGCRRYVPKRAGGSWFTVVSRHTMSFVQFTTAERHSNHHSGRIYYEISGTDLRFSSDVTLKVWTLNVCMFYYPSSDFNAWRCVYEKPRVGRIVNTRSVSVSDLRHQRFFCNNFWLKRDRASG